MIHHAQRLRNKYYINHSIRTDAVQLHRFRSSGEIYESIQSAIYFAPWIRRIFVVVDDLQKDRFMNLWEDKVTIVTHSQIYTKHSKHLPVFNSHSIESHLYEIPGLSEYFLYANDDTFFGDHVLPTQVF